MKRADEERIGCLRFHMGTNLMLENILNFALITQDLS